MTIEQARIRLNEAIKTLGFKDAEFHHEAQQPCVLTSYLEIDVSFDRVEVERETPAALLDLLYDRLLSRLEDFTGRKITFIDVENPDAAAPK